MASAPQTSFSRGQRWAIGFRVTLVSIIVVTIVVLLNILNQDVFTRVNLSDRSKLQLSGRTLTILKGITNNVKVTLYYDKNDGLFSTVRDLLKEYSLANPKIQVQTVDYLTDPASSQKLKNTYHLSAATDKNLVIFDAEGIKTRVVDGAVLAQYTLEQVPSETERQFRRKPIAFLGEVAFTSALLDVTDRRDLTAYFLQGHREHDIESGDEGTGYVNFSSFVKQNKIKVQTLTLTGTNTIPTDCNLLVVAGPKTALTDHELAQIETYLSQGGRMLALFSAGSIGRQTGLEPILAKWGVAIGNQVIVDPEHSQFGSDVIISAFTKHPVTNPLLTSGLFLVQPRPIGKLSGEVQPADAPKVEEIAYTGQNAYLTGDANRKRLLPVAVAVDKPPVRGVVTPRGGTRIVVVGDSVFLANRQFDLLGNRDFAGFAVNWLLDRAHLVEGLGPKPVKEYRLVMTRAQLQAAQLLLLAGMPGVSLLIGGFVWLRRRR